MRAPLVLINPELLDRDDAVVHGREGCLSIPGYMSRKVPRAATVKMAGLNHHLARMVHEVDGDVARTMQHEYDHLDGVLYIDRLRSADDLEPHLDGWLTKAETVVAQVFAAPSPLQGHDMCLVPCGSRRSISTHGSV